MAPTSKQPAEHLGTFAFNPKDKEDIKKLARFIEAIEKGDNYTRPLKKINPDSKKSGLTSTSNPHLFDSSIPSHLKGIIGTTLKAPRRKPDTTGIARPIKLSEKRNIKFVSLILNKTDIAIGGKNIVNALSKESINLKNISEIEFNGEKSPLKGTPQEKAESIAYLMNLHGSQTVNIITPGKAPFTLSEERIREEMTEVKTESQQAVPASNENPEIKGTSIDKLSGNAKTSAETQYEKICTSLQNLGVGEGTQSGDPSVTKPNLSEAQKAIIKAGIGCDDKGNITSIDKNILLDPKLMGTKVFTSESLNRGLLNSQEEFGKSPKYADQWGDEKTANDFAYRMEQVELYNIDHPEKSYQQESGFAPPSSSSTPDENSVESKIKNIPGGDYSSYANKLIDEKPTLANDQKFIDLKNKLGTATYPENVIRQMLSHIDRSASIDNTSMSNPGKLKQLDQSRWYTFGGGNNQIGKHEITAERLVTAFQGDKKSTPKEKQDDIIKFFQELPKMGATIDPEAIDKMDSVLENEIISLTAQKADLVLEKDKLVTGGLKKYINQYSEMLKSNNEKGIHEAAENIRVLTGKNIRKESIPQDTNTISGGTLGILNIKIKTIEEKITNTTDVRKNIAEANVQKTFDAALDSHIKTLATDTKKAEAQAIDSGLGTSGARTKTELLEQLPGAVFKGGDANDISQFFTNPDKENLMFKSQSEIDTLMKESKLPEVLKNKLKTIAATPMKRKTVAYDVLKPTQNEYMLNALIAANEKQPQVLETIIVDPKYIEMLTTQSLRKADTEFDSKINKAKMALAEAPKDKPAERLKAAQELQKLYKEKANLTARVKNAESSLVKLAKNSTTPTEPVLVPPSENPTPEASEAAPHPSDQGPQPDSNFTA